MGEMCLLSEADYTAGPERVTAAAECPVIAATSAAAAA